MAFRSLKANIIENRLQYNNVLDLVGTLQHYIDVISIYRAEALETGKVSETKFYRAYRLGCDNLHSLKDKTCLNIGGKRLYYTLLGLKEVTYKFHDDIYIRGIIKLIHD